MNFINQALFTLLFLGLQNPVLASRNWTAILANGQNDSYVSTAIDWNKQAQTSPFTIQPLGFSITPPMLYKDKAYVLSRDHDRKMKVVAYDLKHRGHRRIWQHKTDALIAFNKGIIHLTQYDKSLSKIKILYANADTGEIQKTIAVDVPLDFGEDIYSAPFVSGNNFYLYAIDSENEQMPMVYAFDAQSGRSLWRRQFNMKQDSWFPGFYDNFIYMVTPKEAIKVDGQTGEILQSLPIDIKPTTSAKKKLGYAVYDYFPLVLDANRIIFESDNGVMIVNFKNAHIESWISSVGTKIVSNKQHIYVIEKDHLQAYDKFTYRWLWQVGDRLDPFDNLVAATDNGVLLTRQGKLMVVNLQGEEIPFAYEQKKCHDATASMSHTTIACLKDIPKSEILFIPIEEKSK